MKRALFLDFDYIAMQRYGILAATFNRQQMPRPWDDDAGRHAAFRWLAARMPYRHFLVAGSSNGYILMLTHAGQFRSPYEQAPITRRHKYTALPASPSITIFKMASAAHKQCTPSLMTYAHHHHFRLMIISLRASVLLRRRFAARRLLPFTSTPVTATAAGQQVSLSIASIIFHDDYHDGTSATAERISYTLPR